MKTRHLIQMATLLGLVSSSLTAAPLGAAFTYQGRLTEGGSPANGSYDLRFILYDAEAGGNQTGPLLTNVAVSVNGGLFAVPVDFGAGVFTGEARWLEIGVRTNGGGAFATLAPRQPLTPAPQALYAPTAGTATTVAPGAVTASGIASGQVVKSLNTLHDSVLLLPGTNVSVSTVGNAITISATPGTVVTNAGWGLSGNAGTTVNHFLGTTDGQALNLRVNNARALRLEPGTPTPNLIGGSAGNSAAAGVTGATVAGGGNASAPHRVTANYGTVGGGLSNTVAAATATISGGSSNSIGSASDRSTIGGGYGNTIGSGNLSATISGGELNAIGYNSDYSTIGGGYGNYVAFNSFHTTIAGGYINNIGKRADFGAIGGGEDNNIADDTVHATIGGGYRNGIGSGANYSEIGGGYDNNITAPYGSIGGGLSNAVSGIYATVPGGFQNTASGTLSFAAGSRAKALHTASFVWADNSGADFTSTAANQFLIRAASVGINKNSPQATLDLVTRASDQYALRLQNLAANGGTNIRLVDGSGRWADINHYYGEFAGRTAASQIGFFMYGGNYFVMRNEPNGAVCNTWISAKGFQETSDRNQKRDVEPVNPGDILERIVGLPISTWAFTNAVNARHLGPMAQDFHAAFGLGQDDKTIAPRDLAGVALAAIQGLNEKVERGEQKAESRMETLETENAALKQAVAELKALVQTLAAKVNGGGQ